MKEHKLRVIERKVNERLTLFIKPKTNFTVVLTSTARCYYKLEVDGIWVTDGSCDTEYFNGHWRQIVMGAIGRMVTCGLFTEKGWEIPERKATLTKKD